MLSTPWEQRKNAYDFVVIGSGYGGAITAARLATANLNPKPSRLHPGARQGVAAGQVSGDARRTCWARRAVTVNPLGLYELLKYPDISVIKGSGLGGTSLINANVAIVPDREVFEQFHWPAAITYDALQPYYQSARRRCWRRARIRARCELGQGEGARPAGAGNGHDACRR